MNRTTDGFLPALTFFLPTVFSCSRLIRSYSSHSS